MKPHEHHDVWQIVAALADSRFELRLVAPGEYELVEIADPAQTREVDKPCPSEVGDTRVASGV